MKKKPVFLSLEPAGFEQAVMNDIQKFFEYQEHDHNFSRQNHVRAIYVRFGAKINTKLLDQYPACQFVLCNATGIEHIDEIACQERNINIISLRGETDFLESISATAEFTWLLILSAARKFISAVDSAKSGEWDRDSFSGIQLRKKTLGIVGLGRNGKKIARFAEAFEMKLKAYDPFVQNYRNIEMTDDLATLCSTTDIVCITATSDQTTKHLFNSSVLNHLHKNSILVNTARGEIVDENKLLNLLNKKAIRCYATDVLTGESQYQNNPLFQSAPSLENLILTPHIGGVTTDSWRLTERFVINRLMTLI